MKSPNESFCQVDLSTLNIIGIELLLSAQEINGVRLRQCRGVDE